MHSYIPGYIRAGQAGRLKQVIQQALDMLSPCTLCPRQCRVDRTHGETGYCGAGSQAKVADFAPHFGEEPPLVGVHGSGTIFFSHCSLRCVFCQNHDISIQGDGRTVFPNQLAAMMIRLQEQGCHNINFVTPTHVVPRILQALDIAVDLGLHIPLVYNSSGYDSPDTLALLDGIIDIYMPDFKFRDNKTAGRFCNATDYPETAQAAIRDMHAQVGDLEIGTAGIACSGLLVRHLVMPGHLEDTRRILEFLKTKVSPGTHVNLMSQYRPMGEAVRFSDLCHPLSAAEFRQALEMVKASGLTLVR
ncbi:MAG: radical SAM protein [Desulfotignum sp.]|nr:radical SAM protein [Desulfotignum sp.]